MQIKADSPEDYINQLPEDRKEVITKLRMTILANLPTGFIEIISYGMLGYVVPHSIYPPGYHANPKLPLPLMNLASQKNHVAIYHLGIYGNQKLLNWFTNEYKKQFNSSPEMGKGCIRFKKMDRIPFELIGELTTKISVSDWIEIYESNLKKYNHDKA
jgi:uncharacterized protein YdhG (YjbR/CyaY superfamily)